MAGFNRAAFIIAGIAGLGISAAAGAALGSYCASGINPIHGRPNIASLYTDEPAPPGAGASDRAALDQFSEAAVRHLTDQAVADRSDDRS